jgi:hypothetical protein
MTTLALPKHAVPPPPPVRSFALEPQRLEHTELDYEAVRASQGHLRRWSDSSWPEDDFSVAANREDLGMHIAEAEQGIAYGYTVFSPERDKVYGSLYLNPISMFAENYRLDEAAEAVFAQALVEVDYWLRPELEADDAFHRGFVETVHAWLVAEWGYQRPLWGSREQLTQRRIFYRRIGMKQTLELDSKRGRPRRMWLHEP